MKDAPQIPPRSASLEATRPPSGERPSVSDPKPLCDDAHRKTRDGHRDHGTGPLEYQRANLVDELVRGHAANPSMRLDEAGKAVFETAGFKDRIDRPSDIEVITRNMEPVVKETITRQIHTEYTTEITRDVHKYHEYPVIQPLHDPNPIILPTRHRFFSSIDNQWHEVIGDDAAIAILGHDVFMHGPKQIRLVRDTFDPTRVGSSPIGNEPRVIERERGEADGHSQDEWTLLQGVDEADQQVVKQGKLKDGHEGLEEGVRTLHVEL